MKLLGLLFICILSPLILLIVIAHFFFASRSKELPIEPSQLLQLRPQIEKLIADLEQLAESKVGAEHIGSTEELIQRYDFESVDAFNNTIHYMTHFLTDEDIRNKDSVYDQIMREELLRLAAEIRASYLDSSICGRIHIHW